MPNQHDRSWTAAKTVAAKKVLAKHGTIVGACADVARAVGFPVTATSIKAAFARTNAGRPSSFLKPAPAKAARALPDDQAQLVTLFKATKSPLKFSDLCDKLDLSPVRTKALIERARAAGVDFRVEHDHVGVVLPAPDDRVRDLKIAPVVGQRQMVGVISDTHLGSKYCLREQIKEFVHYAYERGVREILHPGDVLDGDYRHGKFEMTHMGLEEQSRDLFETLPRLKGLTYHAITGNHDFTFTEGSGVSVGRYLSDYFARRGRSDLHFHGDRGAFLRLRGAVIHLWHPRSGVSYARSYALQKHIEKYSSGEKPHIMLAGHWHIYCHVYERGVHAFACPTFQGGGSAFAKSIGGAPAIGGLILSWDMTRDGTLRALGNEMRSYFEKETPIRIDDRDSGIMVA